MAKFTSISTYRPEVRMRQFTKHWGHVKRADRRGNIKGFPSAECLERRYLLSTIAGLSHTTLAFPGERGEVSGGSLGGLAFFAGFTYDQGMSGRSAAVATLKVRTGRWYRDTLSLPRASIGITSVSNLVIFAGGLTDNSSDNGAVANVDIYSATRNRWTTAQLSAPRWDPSAVSVGGLALIAGGYGLGNVASGVVDIYYARRGLWSVQSLSTPRAAMGATTAGDQALFAGGFDPLNQVSDVVDVYSAATNQWSVAHLSQARAGAAAVSVDGVAIFAGGKSASLPPSDVVDIYNPTTGAWTVTHLPAVDGVFAGAAVGDDAVFFDGLDLDIYNVRTGTWTSAQFSKPVHGETAGVSVPGHALFAGGIAASGRPSAIVDDYMLVGSPAPPTAEPTFRLAASAAAFSMTPLDSEHRRWLEEL